MAARTFQQFQGSLEKGVVKLWCYVSVGGSGAVTFKKWTWENGSGSYATADSSGYGGVVSVTKTGTGLWSVLLQDTYARVLGVTGTTFLAGGTATAVAIGVNTTLTDVTSLTAPTVAVALLDSTAHAANPASGDNVLLEITLQNSTAP